MRDQHSVSYEFESFRLDPSEHRLTREGQPLELAPKAFALLHMLVKNAGHLVEKDVLLREVWPDSFVEEGNLTVYVAALRKALGERDTGRRFIETVPKRGYRFTASVKEAISEGVPVLLAQRTRIHAVTEEEEIEISDEGGPVLGHPPASPIAVEQTAKNSAAQRRSILSRQRVLLLGAVTLLATGLSVAFVLRPRFGSKPTVVPFAFGSFSWQKLSNDDKGGPVLISPDGEFIVYSRNEGNGAVSLRMRRLGSDETVTVIPSSQRQTWGTTLTHDGNYVYCTLVDDVPDTATLYKFPVLGGPPRKILDHINSPATLSPDDQRLAFMRFDTKRNVISLITANANDGSDERVIESSDNGPPLVQPVWSPDGTRIACFVRERKPDGNYWSLVEIPANGGPIKGITTPRRQQIWWFAWMPDGQGFVMNATDTVSGKVQIYYVSYPSGETSRITNDLNQYTGVSVNAAGNILVAAQIERESSIYLAPDNEPRTRIKITTTACCPDALDWTADGRIVFDAVDDGHRHLWIMNGDGGGQQKLSPEKSDDWQPSVSPDGRYLVFLSNRSGARELWRTDLDGRNPRQLTYGSDSLWLAGISADGQWVYYTQYKGGMRVLLRTALNGGEATQITNVQTDLWSISPEGKLLAYSFFDEKQQRGRVAVQSLDGATPPSYFDIAPNDILRWTPDGKALLYKDSDPKVDVDSTLWQQPIAGGRPHPVLAWPGQINYWAAWSRDGHTVAVVRGRQVANMVMLKQQGQ